MIKQVRSRERISIEKMTPMAMKRDVPTIEIQANYNWNEQRGSDTLKFGTYGSTSQFSPGKILNDADSYTD